MPYHTILCHAIICHIISSHIMPCHHHAMPSPCHIMPFHTISIQAMSYQDLTHYAIPYHTILRQRNHVGSKYLFCFRFCFFAVARYPCLLLQPKGYKVRLYVLQALNLTPMDIGLGGRPGKSDPYLKISLGKEVSPSQTCILCTIETPPSGRGWLETPEASQV